MVNNDPPPAAGGAAEEGVLKGFGAGVAPLGGLNMKDEPAELVGRFTLLLAGEAG